MPKTAQQWEDDQHWWSRAERSSAELPTTLREPDAPPADATILNFSSSGCLIVSDREIPLGSAISLAFPELGPVPAHIVRRDGDRYGCAFARPLPAAAMNGVEPVETVVRLSFSNETDGAEETEEPPGWPAGARLLFALLTATALWAVILSLF